VKHWQETARILDRVIRLGQQGRPAAIAIVTRIEGSAYRRPGAKLLIEEGGALLGGVSGGCLEEDVRQVGLRVLSSGRSRVLHYETGADETRLWGLGLGCDGRVDLVVQPIAPQAALGTWARVRSLLDGDSPFALSTIVEDGAPGGFLAVGESGRLAGDTGAADEREVEAAARAALGVRRPRLEAVGSRQVFTEILLPPPKLLVCGAGDDARPIVALAASVGFRVFVADHRSKHLEAQRLPEAHRLLLLRPDEATTELPTDPDTYAVVKTHSLEHDTAWVQRLIETDVSYLGILGPRARTRRILADLGVADDARVFGPVGLDLGAEGPEQVAVSVVAELLAVQSRREPRHLREREVAVHAQR
jgi:xanthine/CO dehydrogenase XdhC/CoxF family maturation factor